MVVKVSTDFLTDLEGTIVSTLARRPGETAYFVRQTFINSPSSYWSGSSGSIYPAIHRLVERGLLEALPRKSGRKKSVGYQLTATGKEAHMDWVKDPARACDTGFDPFRARLANLDFMPANEKISVLKAWRSELEASFATIEIARKGASASAGFDMARRMQDVRLAFIETCLNQTDE